MSRKERGSEKQTGLEEIVADPAVQAGLEQQLFVPVPASKPNSRFVADASKLKLQSPPARIFLHTGLDAPVGLPPETPVVPMETEDLPETIIFYNEHAPITGDDIAIVNIKILSPVKVWASMPLSEDPMGVIGSYRGREITMAEALFLAAVSKQVGPVLNWKTNWFTANDGRTYILVDILA